MTALKAGRKHRLPGGVVTFLMTDIEGSTVLFQDLGDQYLDVLAEHNSLIRSAVRARGGVEVGTEGDSLLIAFDRADDAVASSLEAQLALDRHEWPPGATVKVRMGIHTGEAHPVGDDYVSLVLHQVARISSSAHGGQVLLSEATANAVAGRLTEQAELIELGSFQLRGFPTPERLFQLRHPDLPESFPPLRAIGVSAHNLPFHRTSFVGRSEERKAIADLLRATGLVTLVGSAGVGKTRLAVELGFEMMDRFSDGVWIAELAPLTRPEGISSAIASAMGIPGEPGVDPDQHLIEALGPKSTLLILDNCEHLIEAASSLAERIAQHCPRVNILATSREPLDVEGEAVWRLEPLTTAAPDGVTKPDGAGATDAVRLFVERAGLVHPGFELSEENAPQIEGIVSQLDGVPLAIELAAAALSYTSTQGVLDGLSDRLSLLTHGRRTAPGRHQTLRGAIGWSLDLIDVPERRLFARLSVFAGSWTTEAAAAVCASDPITGSEVSGLLGRLARASLLSRDTGSGDRWSMHESVRQVAEAELEEVGEVDDMAGRHREWYAQTVEALSGEIGIHGHADTMSWLEREHDNVRRALDTAIAGTDAVNALGISAAMAPFWTSHGDWSEGIQRTRDALNLEGGDDRLRARANAGLGRLLLLTGDMSDAETVFDAALSSPDHSDPATTARALSGVGYVAFRHSDLDRAERSWNEALKHAERADDQRIVAEVLRSLSIAAGTRGEQSRARELLERGIDSAQRAGDDQLLRLMLTSSAEISLWQGLYQAAEESYGQALELAARIGDISARPLLLAELGWMALLRGRPVTADRIARESIELAEDLGNRRVWAHALRLSGEALWRIGQPSEASGALEQALEVAEHLNAPAETAGVLCSQARLALEQKQFEVAATIAEQANQAGALAHTMRLHSLGWVLGMAALERGDFDLAREQLESESEIAERIGSPRYRANSWWALAALGERSGSVGSALPNYAKSLQLRHEMGDRLGVVESLIGVASATADHRPQAAEETLRSAEALGVEVGAVDTPLQSATLARVWGRLRGEPGIVGPGESADRDEDGVVAAALTLAEEVVGTTSAPTPGSDPDTG